MRRYTQELIGTFFLVLTIGLTGIAAGPGAIPPLAIGSILMVMVYAGGHISGAHYNPAVTLGVFLRGSLPLADVAPYMAAQVFGAVIAASVVMIDKAGEPAPVPFVAHSMTAAFLAEFFFTFALVYVVLNVATSKATAGNSYFGLAIGFTVMCGAFAVGNISGAAFNPAVAVGGTVMGLMSPTMLAIYLAGDFLGGAAAAAVFKAVAGDQGQ